MCNVLCFNKLSQNFKKYQLQKMLNNNARDLMGNPVDVDKINNFINTADCCKNCVKNTTK